MVILKFSKYGEDFLLQNFRFSSIIVDDIDITDITDDKVEVSILLENKRHTYVAKVKEVNLTENINDDTVHVVNIDELSDIFDAKFMIY